MNSNGMSVQKEMSKSLAISLNLPRENVSDGYLSVRLEAGTLHLAKYLIPNTVYFLMQRYRLSSELQNQMES